MRFCGPGMPLCFPIWAPLWTRALHPRRAVLPLSRAATRVTSRPCQPNSSSGNRQDPPGRERCYDVACSQHAHTIVYTSILTNSFAALLAAFCCCVQWLVFFSSLSASHPPFSLCELNTNWGFVRRQHRLFFLSSIISSRHTHLMLRRYFCHCFVLFVKGECPDLLWLMLSSSQVSVISFSDRSW